MLIIERHREEAPEDRPETVADADLVAATAAAVELAESDRMHRQKTGNSHQLGIQELRAEVLRNQCQDMMEIKLK